MKKSIIISVILIIAAFLIGYGWGAQKQGVEEEAGEIEEKQVEEQAEKKEAIKIGGIVPLTGDGAVYGVPIQRFAEYARQEVNEAGGIKGRELEFIWEDGKCNPKDSSTATIKLINIDKVKIVYGGVCSGETLGAAPIAEQNKVILFSPASTSPDITTAGDFVFRNAPSDATQGRILAKLAWDLGYKKVAIIQEQTDYALGIKNVFEQQFKQLGGEVTTEVYLSEGTDFRTQLTKLKGSQPDALLLDPQTPNKVRLIIRQAVEIGLDVPFISNEILFGAQDVIAELKESVEGVVGGQIGFETNHPTYQKLAVQYEKDFGAKAPYGEYMARAYDAVYILMDAVDNSLTAEGEIDTIKMRDYLYSIKDRPGLAGILTIDVNGDPQAGHSLKQIKDGTVVSYE